MSDDAGGAKLADLKYLVTSVLGTDGNRTVMRILDKPTGRQFALKVMKREEPDDDAAIECARAECEGSAKCGHPSILKVHDFRTKRSWFRVARAESLREYVDGKDLDKLPDLPIGPAIMVLHKVASALAHMHRRGVIHGDVRPGNVMLSRTGQVKVRGYGHSLVKDAMKAQIKPRAPYAAPERTKEKKIDDKADVYSLGVTMYRVLCGKALAEEGGRARGDKGASPQSLNPQIPTPLSNLVVSCMRSNPAQRPPDMYQVVKQLEGLVKEMSLQESALAGIAAEEEA